MRPAACRAAWQDGAAWLVCSDATERRPQAASHARPCRLGGRIHTHTLRAGGVESNVDLGATFVCGAPPGFSCLLPLLPLWWARAVRATCVCCAACGSLLPLPVLLPLPGAAAAAAAALRSTPHRRAPMAEFQACFPTVAARAAARLTPQPPACRSLRHRPLPHRCSPTLCRHRPHATRQPHFRVCCGCAGPAPGSQAPRWAGRHCALRQACGAQPGVWRGAGPQASRGLPGGGAASISPRCRGAPAPLPLCLTRPPPASLLPIARSTQAGRPHP